MSDRGKRTCAEILKKQVSEKKKKKNPQPLHLFFHNLEWEDIKMQADR